MNNCKEQKLGQKKEEVSYDDYEEAMNQAFTEIFQNLKVIEEDTIKKQREKVYLQRRRGSAPAAMLRKTTTLLQQPKNELAKSRSVEWVLQCIEEEEACS